MIDQKTINREYPLPHPDNMLEEDVTRIKDSFEKIDIDVDDLYGTTAQSIEDAQSGTYWYAVSTGTEPAYEINLTPSPTALNTGMFIHMKAHAKNSGPVTVDVNLLGVKTVKKIDGSDLKPGDIPENGIVTLAYDGTNFQLANSAMDKEQTGVNTSNLMRAFEEIQENHGGALLMEAGWSDSFGNADEQGADEANSSGFQHDNTNKFYKGTDPGLGLSSDKNYDTESNFIQQEWTNVNQSTSQATVASGTTVTLSSGTWPVNCVNGRLSFDGGSTWFGIDVRDSDSQLTLNSSAADGDFDYIIRLSEFHSGVIQLNYFGTSSLDQSATATSGSYGLGHSSVNIWKAQTFTAGISGNLTKIQIKLNKTGSPNDNLEFRIQSTSGGVASGVDLSSIESLSSSSLTGSFVFYDVNFSTPANVTSGTKYAIVMNRTGGVDSSNYYNVEAGTCPNAEWYNGSANPPTSGGSGDSIFNTFVGGNNSAYEYVSICDIESQKVVTSAWSDINSGSVTETLNSQNAYYWLVFDPTSGFGAGTEVKIFNPTNSVWRVIAKKNGAVWEYNNDSSNNATYSGTAATVNDMLHAVSQAISTQAGNRMTGTNLAAITDTEWEETGGWSTAVNSVVRGITLYSNDFSQNPSVSQYRLNFDSERGAMDLRSKTYDPGFIPSEGYLWLRIEHSDSDGPGTFYVSGNGGTDWTVAPMVQQGLPLSGDIRIYRGTVDVNSQASGQDLRCRYQSSQGKDQFLHSWGLQAKS